MSWLNQFTLVMRSSITSLRESVENPERMLHQLIVDMEEELDRVRRSVAEAVADEIQMRKRAERERAMQPLGPIERLQLSNAMQKTSLDKLSNRKPRQPSEPID